MKSQISLHYAPAKIAINSIAGRAYVLKVFPSEFKKDWIRTFDRRLGLIFLLCLVLVYGGLVYQASQPKKISSGTMDLRLLKKLGQVMRVNPNLLFQLESQPKTETKENEMPVHSNLRIRGIQSSRISASNRLQRAELARQQAIRTAQVATQNALRRGVMAVVGETGNFKGKYHAVDLTSSGIDLDAALERLDHIGFATDESDKSIIGSKELAKQRQASIEDLAGLLGTQQTLSMVEGQPNNGLVGVAKARLDGDKQSASVAADYQSVFDRQMMAIHACYVKELKRSPELKGKLSLQIRINPNGNVSGIQITENTIGNEVSQCVQSKIRHWKFPKGRKGMISLHQTFVFSK